MHRQTFIFLPHQTSSINRKINHKNNQPEQSIKSNNQKKQGPATTQSKAPKDKHNKQLRKNAMFLNIKIIAGWFTADKYFPEPTSKHSLLIKTQYNRKKQNNITYTLR